MAADNEETPTTLVVLGATGDLAGRLLFPALYRLATVDRLPDMEILGFGLDEWDDETFRTKVREHLDEASLGDGDTWDRFSSRLTYRQGELSQEDLKPLADEISGNAVFYLALPPGLFAQAATAIAEAGLAPEGEDGWRRLVIEKPFGTDLASAKKLNQELHQHWHEDQIFRIDHFLGKETVQNLLVFRFANRFLEPVFNAAHIEQVQITVAETLGLEGRYRYYDRIGALRDMVQNHLLQLFSLVAIEPPSIWDADVLRDHKVEVLKSVHPLDPETCERDAVRGQYVAGVIDGTRVPGYREEEGVDASSSTETFAAVRLQVDNWRWKGVPFYLRTGKRMRAKDSEIAVQFRSPPTRLFDDSQSEGSEPDWLVFQLQPDESIHLSVRARAPGLGLAYRSVHLRADYAREDEAMSSAYEQLILDVLEGVRAPFLRFDEVEWAWRIMEPLLEAWKDGSPEPYYAGSEGPAAQSRLLGPGHTWRPIS